LTNFFILCASSIICLSNCSQLNVNPKVVGGRSASILEFPYLVSLNYNDRAWCAGTILNEYWILTAAHCAVPASNAVIEYNASFLRGINNTENTVPVEEFIIHEDFDFDTITNDIGLIKLKEPIDTSFHQDPFAKLAMPGSYYATGTPAVVAGWGIWDYLNTSFVPPLQKADTFVVSSDDCHRALANNQYDLPVTRSNICAAVPDFTIAECNGYEKYDNLFAQSIQYAN
jgi:secreted trypsin-like serine protease